MLKTKIQNWSELVEIIDVTQALALWDRACATKWDKKPVWIHGGDMSRIMCMLLKFFYFARGSRPYCVAKSCLSG